MVLDYRTNSVLELHLSYYRGGLDGSTQHWLKDFLPADSIAGSEMKGSIGR